MQEGHRRLKEAFEKTKGFGNDSSFGPALTSNSSANDVGTQSVHNPDIAEEEDEVRCDSR